MQPEKKLFIKTEITLKLQRLQKEKSAWCAFLDTASTKAQCF